jgi:hypothetical protein
MSTHDYNLDTTTTARHLATASSRLLEALHYHRFFGAPIAEFSARHNQQRAEANTRRIRALARDAGTYLRYAGADLGVLVDRYPEACAVPGIREALEQGWRDTGDLLADAE